MKAPLALIFLLTISDTLSALPIQPPSQQDSRPSIPWKKYIPILSVLGAVSLLAIAGHKADEVYTNVQEFETGTQRSKLPPELHATLSRAVGRETPLQWDGTEEMLERENDIARAFDIAMPDLTVMDFETRRRLERQHRKVEMAMKEVDEAVGWREMQEEVLREEQTKIGILLATEWRDALAEARASRTEGDNIG